jgi:uncharacterized protein YukE
MTGYVKMVFETMDEMNRVFQNTGQQLANTSTRIQNIATEIEAGALQGEAANEFVAGVRNRLLKGVTSLQDKMTELAGDVNEARILLERDAQSEINSRLSD